MNTVATNKRSLSDCTKYGLLLACLTASAGGLLAQSVTPDTTPAKAKDANKSTDVIPVEEEVIQLTPFEVSAESSKGYVATQTLAGSRINTKMEDVGSAISIITPEFLKDIAATDNKSLLMYTTNTEVGGAQGNFRGSSGGQNEDETGKFTSPNQNTRVRGLTSADNTRNFFMSDIPWDGYNVERVDMQRGPNSILFGLGSPAGIINTTTKTAQHRNFGEVQFRTGAWGSTRFSLDQNINLVKKELSLRYDLVDNDEKYKQKPAYSHDKRGYATLRWDPKLLSKNGNHTTIKVSGETGTIRSNNPRTITPTDCITGWWSHLSQTVYDPSLVQNSGLWYNADGSTYYRSDAGAYNKTHTDGTTNPTYQPWLGAPSMYGGLWMQVNQGSSSPYSVGMPEYKNINGIGTNGAVDGSIGGLPFARRVTVATTAYEAERDSSAKYQSWGLWKSTTLSDPSVFDFYNNLLDGDNKYEWQNFHNMNASVTQTFLHDHLGFEVAYDRAHQRSGQYSFGASTLYVDINSKNLDGTANPNVGKAYVESNYTYGNNMNDNQREASRLSIFGNYDFEQAHPHNWFFKLIGHHVLSGLYSRDEWQGDSRSFKRYGTPDSFGSMLATGTNASYMDSNDRAVTATVYLSNSLLGNTSAKNLNISRASLVSVPSTAQFRYFNSTWNGGSVSPSAAWTSTYNGSSSTQSENPANYVGWTSTPVKIYSAENGDMDELTYSATLNKRKVESKAAVWQGYFWDSTIVGMYGIRNDKVKSWAYSGTLVNDRVDFNALDSNGMKQYSTAGKPYTLHEGNSPSWSIVARPTKFLPDRFPFKIGLYYNESQNFQVTGTRNNIYGQALEVPSGHTQDRGITIATKDDMFSLRINKYVTKVKNATNTTGFPTWFLLGQGNFIQRNEDRADAYEYHLGTLGDPSSANQNGSWVWRYSPAAGQTQADADALCAAAVAGWRAYTSEPIVKRILAAWGFNDFNVTQLTTMKTPVANFVATEDQVSKGWEYEFTANPTKNWRITMNASESQASRSNIGGKELNDFVQLTNTYENGPMGQIRQWGGSGISSTSLVSWNSNFYSKYLLMKLQEGTFSSELRKWRYNAVTNYTFSKGFLKGFSIGGGYRWQDRVAIGYPVKEVNGQSVITFDIDHPYYGPALDAIDLWVGYERKLSKQLTWQIQLNVRNVGDGNRLIPLSTQYDGTVAAWGIAPVQTWQLTNTIRF